MTKTWLGGGLVSKLFAMKAWGPGIRCPLHTWKLVVAVHTKSRKGQRRVNLNRQLLGLLVQLKWQVLGLMRSVVSKIMSRNKILLHLSLVSSNTCIGEQTHICCIYVFNTQIQITKMIHPQVKKDLIWNRERIWI